MSPFLTGGELSLAAAATSFRISGNAEIASGISGTGTGILKSGEGTLTLEDGARVEWKASEWEGAAGTGFDQIDASSLDLAAEAGITVVLGADSLANFTESAGSFILVRMDSGFTGFDVENFTIDDGGFPGATGRWALEVVGGDLMLRYTPLATFETWQLNEFGEEAKTPLTAGEMADPDLDGLTNLLEFALGTNPRLPDVATISHDMAEVSGSGHLRLTIERNPAATDVVCIVECTDDLSDLGGWSAVDTFIEEDNPARLVVRDTLGGPRRIMRWRVTR